MTEPDLEPVDILLVDDRPSNLTSLEALLMREDYNLVTARSGSEALAEVLRRDFALILLDVAMPAMDGYEVASLIRGREQSRRTPIVFVTASVFDMQHVFRGYAGGMVDYLKKPLDPSEVRRKVELFVEIHRQRRRAERQAARIRELERRERAQARLVQELREKLRAREGAGLGRGAT